MAVKTSKSIRALQLAAILGRLLLLLLLPASVLGLDCGSFSDEIACNGGGCTASGKCVWSEEGACSAVKDDLNCSGDVAITSIPSSPGSMSGGHLCGGQGVPEPLWAPGQTPPLIGQPYDDDTSNLDSDAIERRKLDLHYTSAAEAGIGPVPLMIFVHGGGWRGGVRGDVMDKLAVFDWRLYGYSVASLEYRMSHHEVFPAQIEDVIAGVSWLRAHAAEHNLDPERFIIYGTSAGGHLASLLATTASNPSDESRVAALIDFYGPTDLTIALPTPEGSDPNSRIAILLGCTTLVDCPEKLPGASPSEHVDEADPPMLIFHGTKDGSFPMSESFYNKARAAGCDATFVEVEEGEHSLESMLNPRNEFTVYGSENAREADDQSTTMLQWLEDRGLVLGCGGGEPIPVPSPVVNPSPAPTDEEEDEGTTLGLCVQDHCKLQAQKCRQDTPCNSLLLQTGKTQSLSPDVEDILANANAAALADCMCTACPRLERIRSACDAVLMAIMPAPMPAPAPSPTVAPNSDSTVTPESPASAAPEAPTPQAQAPTSATDVLDSSDARAVPWSPLLLLAISLPILLIRR
mmetsp:Transcript_16736/g.20119  ORF Transcript_16736/g.20119 Transcript_16736/m.20119 type:complete len:577 (-) Transcript_16736:293-2023(-)|eukprot:CAMPEP_0197844560 /NCGR_PEP_ID=MMETSP1438-20131217/1544_1 /TAXON_ID=1461541 /ORGANISM="Pterosperma sp., Strain CCMP1384" /LENGTH=576 /DNA_ID=CAMNT_0043455403 /DNA_START=99 /DNA_END=1829 /DNA_ORIENTATION=-